MNLRPFTKSDWAAFAGAARFKGNLEPLVGELVVNGQKADLIVDRDGLFISIATWDGPLFEAYLNGPCALRALALLQPEMTVGDLQLLGFILQGDSNL